MRPSALVLLVTAGFLLIALAGCLGGGDAADPSDGVADPCAWGLCPADPDAHPEWVLPEGATAMRTFGAPYTSVGPLVATDHGLAWAARRDAGLRIEHLGDDGTLRSHPLPTDHQVRTGNLAWDGEAVWVLHVAFPNGTPELTRWRLGDGNVTTWPLPELPLQTDLVDVGPPALLRARQPVGDAVGVVFHTFQDGAVAPLPTDLTYTAHAAVEGNTVLRIERVAFPDGRGAWDNVHFIGGPPFDERSLVLYDLVSESWHVLLKDPDALLGVWARDGRFAYAVPPAPGDGPAPVLWGVDRWDHSLQPIARGTDPRFTPNGVYTWVQSTQTAPSIHFTPQGSAVSSPLVFPSAIDAWAVTDGLVWLAEPSTDPRFDEAPNPTDFVAALYGLA